jgi:hypothetical protein
MPMQRRWIPVAMAGLTMGVMIVGSATARAADSREAREREARKACFTGNVDRGVEILVDLYGETGHPNYIYNQARCFERNGKYDQALLSYEDYLRKAKDLGDVERAQVEKSIAELRAKVAASPAAADGGGAAAPALLSPALDAPGTPTNPAEAVLPPAGGGDRSAADATWPWQRKAGVAALVVAAGGLAVGVAGTLLRHNRGGDFNDVCTLSDGVPMPRIVGTGPDCRGKYDAVKSAERMMWIGYAGAGVFTAAGVALILLAPKPQPGTWATRTSHCAPTLGSAGTGLACAWSF